MERGKYDNVLLFFTPQNSVYR